MSTSYASGYWQVSSGSADEFVARWREFLSWTRAHHRGLESATLLRSEHDPDRFVSFATWTSAEERDAWKQSEDFMTRFSACRQLCDEFSGGDYQHELTI